MTEERLRISFALPQRVKRDLAQRDWADMNHYAQAKNEVIASIMERAEAWATSSGWQLSR